MTHEPHPVLPFRGSQPAAVKTDLEQRMDHLGALSFLELAGEGAPEGVEQVMVERWLTHL